MKKFSTAELAAHIEWARLSVAIKALKAAAALAREEGAEQGQIDAAVMAP